ncbi:hypothetical protein TruAng_002423 [Truncatella angustata]|nr:hypothetical protein TruAng_002423 [Truncatella angustata]
MFAKRAWLTGAFCIVLCSDIVRAGLLEPIRREDASPTSTLTTAARTTSTEDTISQESTTSSRATTTELADSASVASTSIKLTSSTSTTSAATSAPSALNGNVASNSSNIYSNSTIEAGELPIQPRITPGWGVAGAILLITGAIHALIGIKNTWLHTFFSTAFLTGLCTAVLIVYVMILPVSDGVQGAYVVACVCAGVILGGSATIFKELTESLGCLLGGFCLSMWLLTLREGGLLLDNSTGTIIFIIAFTLAGFALYFSHYTRPYALIGSISFSGATAAVLGIDCFSKAGYKEFWAYIWALNDNLFPLGATTYPLTKGIRVEIALIVIISIVGIISQVKLWKVLQEHQTKRATARAEAQRERDLEEANLGQQIEDQTARERRQWEAAYGGKADGSVLSSKDSGVADVNEKKGRYSHATDVIELAELPTPSPNFPESPMTPADEWDEINLTNEAKSRGELVIEDDNQNLGSPAPAAHGKTWVVGADGEANPASIVPQRNSQRFSTSVGPGLTPLPFRIPDAAEGDDDDRSSIATFNDDDDRSVTLHNRASRASLGQRLSVGSAHILRSLSRNSTGSGHSKKKASQLSPTSLSHDWTQSKEDLVSRPRAEEDTRSVAATVDQVSTNGDEDRSKTGQHGLGIEITAELNDKTSGAIGRSNEQPKSPTIRISEDGQAACEKSGPPQSPSVAQSTAPVPAVLTKDHLPTGLSRVASAYRTNEWAKHLSFADLPEPENLRPSPQPSLEEAIKDDEIAAPVKIEELQQTAQNATPAPAVTRSLSSASHSPPGSGPVTRSNSRNSTTNAKNLTVSAGSNTEANSKFGLVKAAAPPSVHATRGFQRRSTSQGQRNSDVFVPPIAEEQHGVRYAETQNLYDDPVSGGISPVNSEHSQSAVRLPVPGVVSYSSPQTLLGKRELLLRNKSSILGMPGPENKSFAPQTVASDAGSLRNYPSRSSFGGQDLDDMPLSQRKKLIRQSSILSAGSAADSRPNSHVGPSYGMSQTMAENSSFNSHQPQRRSTLPSQQAREAQLASFRDSVAKETRVPSSPVYNLTPASSHDLLPSQSGGGLHQTANMSTAEIQRSVEQSRAMLMNQRGQEAQRKEMERQQKERNDRMFEEKMRSSTYLMDAHRDAMRKMQSAAK